MMIKTNGYYLEEPKIIRDDRFKEPIVVLSAFVFLKDKKVQIKSKQEFPEYMKDFIEDDFSKSKEDIRAYKIENNEIIIEKEYNFSEDIRIRIINPEKLYNIGLESHLYFVPWSKLEKTNSNNIKNGIIYELFGENLTSSEKPKKTKKDRAIASPLDTLKNEAQPNSEWIWFLVCFLTIVLIRYILKTYF